MPKTEVLVRVSPKPELSCSSLTRWHLWHLGTSSCIFSYSKIKSRALKRIWNSHRFYLQKAYLESDLVFIISPYLVPCFDTVICLCHHIASLLGFLPLSLHSQYGSQLPPPPWKFYVLRPAPIFLFTLPHPVLFNCFGFLVLPSL